MRAGSESRKPRRLLPYSAFARCGVSACAIAIGVFFGSQEPAYSRIESGTAAAPFAADSKSTAAITHANEARPKLPKAPAQVEMPAPPPIKYFAGLEEPLVATGPVTEAEGKDLDVALKAFHEAPLTASADSDYTDYAKPLHAFLEAHPQSNWNAALYTNLGYGY